MRILAIGNSFSQDATTFLHQAAAAQGIDLTVVNLYIGGCPLDKHWANIQSGEAAYEVQINGESTWRTVSIAQAVAEGGWDAIITQQASHDSGLPETYEPALGRLVAFLRDAAPHARLLLQQTWAYETDSTHPAFPRYHRDQQEMYALSSACYREAAVRHGLELIPCGAVIQQVRTLPGFRYELGEHSLCRDGYHMSLGYGRYLLALCWLKKICGVPVAENGYFPDADAAVNEPLLNVIRHAVDDFSV